MDNPEKLATLGK